MIVSGDGVGVVVHGLRMRQAEIEGAIFARVRSVVSVDMNPVHRAHPGGGDGEYVAGLRATVAAAVDYVLTGIEREGWDAVAIPREAAVQAHRAARSGVSLDTVMRRYMVGQALLWDFILEEADRVDRDPVHPDGSRLREMLRAQAALVDRLVSGVAREYTGELERVKRSRGHRLLERVKMLLADEEGRAEGEGARTQSGLGCDLDYELFAEHVGVIVRGVGAQELLGEVADGLDRRLLSVACGEETVWAWLGGQRPLQMGDLRGAIAERMRRPQAGEAPGAPTGVRVAVGEPAWGLDGWRATHRQAQAALEVALRRAPGATCYRDVALLASALNDRALARALIEIYLTPLEDDRGGGAMLRETLRSYLDSECNVSSAAKTMQAARSTVLKRLRTIELRLGRTLNPCPAELEVALALDELEMGAEREDSTAGDKVHR